MSYFGTKLTLFMIACGLVLGQSDNQQANDPDRIFFPESTSLNAADNIKRSTARSRPDDNVLLASLKIAQRINSIESYEEFLEFVNVPEDKKIHIAGRIGNSEERSNAERPKPANCMPELQAVSLRQENRPSTFYYPSCTRIKRCGGCCGHYLLTCQPVASEIRNFEVIVSEIGEDLQVTYKGKEIVALEEHTKCKCDCKVKPEHCNEKQVYERDECKCACINTDEEEKCKANNNIKLWDSEVCTCACREIEECSTGSYFDHNTCRCQRVPIFSQFGDLSKKMGYRFGQTQRPESVPPVIVTLDASDPRRKQKDDPEY
ncbi:uncharacterized protein LOC118450355 [Vespa mandarinia]|uniref:uncharacterized protein LOC118450355 n=1 Tax=Vespa mandarinia TaxID=7446 RepID=UPI00160942CF|nr:uncharacterized protein LOC118450355 [Vespa mandarinia]